MSVETMREALKQAPKYHGAQRWIERVDNMHAQQVIAVYYRMLNAGEL